jgi:hypothetical protein
MVRVKNHTLVSLEVVEVDLFKVCIRIMFGNGGCVVYNTSIVDNVCV